MEINRRLPFIENSIEDIKESMRVSVSGVVIDRDGKSLILDDGTGKISVLINNSVNNGDYVRIFGSVINFEGDLEVQGEILQNLNSIDKKLHQKVIKMLKG